MTIYAATRDHNALTLTVSTAHSPGEDVFTATELAFVAAELACDRWRITRFELTGPDGAEPELAHAEAYRSIIAYDLATGGPAKVTATLETELPHVRLTGIRAYKTFRQADHHVQVRANGQVITDAPEPIRDLLASACAA